MATFQNRRALRGSGAADERAFGGRPPATSHPPGPAVARTRAETAGVRFVSCTYSQSGDPASSAAWYAMRRWTPLTRRGARQPAPNPRRRGDRPALPRPETGSSRRRSSAWPTTAPPEPPSSGSPLRRRVSSASCATTSAASSGFCSRRSGGSRTRCGPRSAAKTRRPNQTLSRRCGGLSATSSRRRSLHRPELTPGSGSGRRRWATRSCARSTSGSTQRSQTDLRHADSAPSPSGRLARIAGSEASSIRVNASYGLRES